MPTRTADYLEAIEHLPTGAMLVIPGARPRAGAMLRVPAHAKRRPRR